MPSWRKDQNELTKKVIENVDVIPFCVTFGRVNKGCLLNHLQGREGYITLEDALAGRYRVFEYETDQLLGCYDSVDALIQDGWKVST